MAKKRIQHETRLIIILAVLSVIFLGLFFGIKSAENHKNDEDKAYIDMAVMEDFPSSIEVTNKDMPFTLQSEKSEWHFLGKEEIPVDDLKVTGTRSVIKYFTAGRILKDAKDHWADFGLSNPQCKLKVTAGDKTNTYLIGDFNPVTGEYYAALEGGDVVYMIPKADGESLSMTLLDYVADPAITGAEFNRITGMRIEAGDTVYNVDVEGGRYMVRTQEEGFETSQAGVMSIFNCFTARDYNCVDIDADEAELKAYGLDSPEITVMIKEGNEAAEYDMYVGKGTDGIFYITSGDRSIVYAFDSDIAEALKENIKIANLKGAA